MKESVSKSPEGQGKEDETFFIELCQRLEISSPEFEKIIRLGRLPEGKTRPIKVCFQQKEVFSQFV